MRVYCQGKRIDTAAHATSCALEEGHVGPCCYADGKGAFLWLDGYEWANLRELLAAINDHPVGNKLALLNTGDWVGQLNFKLRPYMTPHNQPNSTAEQLREKFQPDVTRCYTK